MTFYYIIEDMDGNVRDEFEYEVEYSDLRNALWEILRTYDKEDLIDFIVNEFTIDDFKDQLQEYFESEAMQCRKER